MKRNVIIKYAAIVECVKCVGPYLEVREVGFHKGGNWGRVLEGVGGCSDPGDRLGGPKPMDDP
jgi:hypothetical protein